MEFYFIIFIVFILLAIVFLFWIYKIFKLFLKKKNKIALIHFSVLSVVILFICWELRIIPIAADNDFKNTTAELTGKEFWSWNDYRFEEIGVRGEGFTFEIYKLNPEMAEYFKNPNKDFFTKFPTSKFETSKWKTTPVSIEENEILEFVTPVYGNWNETDKKEILEKQNLIKKLAKEEGSYYAIRNTNGTDFYLISPKEKIIVYINHNM